MAAEQDVFDQLEQRIQRAVAHTVQLRAENERLRQELEGLKIRATVAEAATADAVQMKTSLQKLESEVTTLQKEREGVRSRVERLLKQIDSLSTT